MRFGLSKLLRRRVEVRESYTDQVVARLVASSMGQGDGAAGLGAIETASRWWGSGLASASVKPDTVALKSVSPLVLDSIGRSLCRHGQSLHMIDVRSGRVRLTPTASWTVLGSDDPESWEYLVTLNGPSTGRTIKVPAASVLHVRYAPHPDRPWAGRSPMQMAVDTARAAGLLEHATSAEFSFVQQQILSPRRNQNDYGAADLTPDLIEKIVASFSQHTGSGALVIPGDLEPRRLGPTPPDSFALLRDRLENSLLALHGIPGALIASNGNAGAMRESFRIVLHTLLKPLGKLVVEELREKLDRAAEIPSPISGPGYRRHKPRPRVARQGRTLSRSSSSYCGTR